MPASIATANAGRLVVAGPAPPLGILAGNGRLPGEIARAVTEAGGRVVIAAIDGEVDDDLAAFAPTRVGLGQVGRILRTFHEAGCRDLVIVGGVTRPDLGRLRPDLGLLLNLPDVLRVFLAGGDDGLLRSVVRFFEAKGFDIVAPGTVAPRLLVGAGAAGAIEPDADDAADMLVGSSVVRALGAFDVGQAVIVRGGRIEAIEAAEGTDRMMARTAAARRPGGERGGVLVKRPKPTQEMRVDLPTIGPNTVARAAEAGLNGIAVLAGATLIAGRAETVAAAAAQGLFLYGFSEAGGPPRAGPAKAGEAMRCERIGAVRVSRGLLADARTGAAVLSSIAELAREGSAVVSRGYVLGIEAAGGNARALFQRVAGLKQWGEGRLFRRTGVAVLGEGVLPDPALVAAAGHLSALALLSPFARRLAPEVIAAADRSGLALLAVGPDFRR